MPACPHRRRGGALAALLCRPTVVGALGLHLLLDDGEVNARSVADVATVADEIGTPHAGPDAPARRQPGRADPAWLHSLSRSARQRVWVAVRMLSVPPQPGRPGRPGHVAGGIVQPLAGSIDDLAEHLTTRRLPLSRLEPGERVSTAITSPPRGHPVT